ncbi:MULTISPECIES: DoxX family protein [unclassified Arthrobacter]|uniref:DoxX family protein n=1 Tax=unclassified Arthrobacter TaxID=235627 RepID=UPI001E3D15CA|nr:MULTISPECIES: DoxX family protein [unclassified Arthrobacter]MCC9145819.1 DoxX family protein [Arthrobacter sp. zg-Y919]MDK1277048.1 DoxX family protein [Arthrobacter sp. zg.Y919]MDM7990838.1 DoxX family protein [Arthrobacter sp. zg-Y877]WIB03577.1 DoxX family protein [Arthrobacter sp. zg-Y919]
MLSLLLWLVQLVLALLFAGVGFMKIFQGYDRLKENLRWPEDFSAGTVKLIGVLEVLGALGLILPGVTGVLPVLTAVAASALAVLMALAVLVHVRRGERNRIALAVILMVLSLVVALGRFGLFA